MPDRSPMHAEPPPRLGQILDRLDEIRRELDREDLDLEAQLALYREGCGHVLRAKQILNQVRSEVDLLMSEADAAEVRGAEP
jgi:exodeoxyribonuclease VII small subunit